MIIISLSLFQRTLKTDVACPWLESKLLSLCSQFFKNLFATQKYIEEAFRLRYSQTNQI